MEHLTTKGETWKKVLAREGFLPLPVAHDALTARLIERAGFKAYQIGGFGLAGSRHAVPDIDLEQYGEISPAVENIVAASKLPVLVDCDDGYGDSKNVTRTVMGYRAIGASAIFIEDQLAPKRCGHMAGKKVIPMEKMVRKLKAAVSAREGDELFILARTDAIAPEGLDEAMIRASRYLEAGAEGVYFEGPTSVTQLERIGREFGRVPLATSVLERGGVTPWLSAKEFEDIGFSMILYPSTLIFRVTQALQAALKDLKGSRQLDPAESVNMDQFEEIVGLQFWKKIEKQFEPEEGGKE